MLSRYKASTRFLSRAEMVIPVGSQTFSKSRTQYPAGISPLFAVKSKGAYLWDLDGNRYIDLVSNLASVTLGYRNKKVDALVRRQMKRGNGFSLPSTLETEVAEKILSLVPSAEMVRFGKNGTDATSAAVRLARAYTGRDLVAVCGYHGWQDWFIGSTSKNKGVPNETSKLTHSFKYNDITSLISLFDSHQDRIAAVILEPMTYEFPRDGFLEQVKALCEKNGSVLVFDETITGFRFAKGGAQEIFQISPHLTTFGKGIANGYPLSVICGDREIMKEMENIFFSGTFGGELLSLAAADAVLGMHQKDEVSPLLCNFGENLARQIEKMIKQTKMDDFLTLQGHPTWKFLVWREGEGIGIPELKTFFMQEIFRRGLLLLGTHNVSLAHEPRICQSIVRIYEEVLTVMRCSISNGTLSSDLLVEPLQPLFRVR